MVKLTPELINQSMQFINACRDRELDLRGYKIPQIENMGATLDQFDTIDFSDNDLRKLDGFPYLARLKCLLLNNNRIVRVSDTLKETLPNLESVILTGNNIQELGDLEALSHLPKLQTLCLLMNPVSTKPHYREYMAYKFPNLRLLDFRKIKQKDRKAAQDMFKTKKGKELAKEISKRAKTFVPGAGLENQKERVPGATPADMQAIREAIKNATSLQEVERLTRMLQAGQIPNGSNFNQMSINGNGNGHGAEEEEEMEEEERQEVVEHVEQQQQPQQVDIQEEEEQADEDSQQEQVVQEEKPDEEDSMDT